LPGLIAAKGWHFARLKPKEIKKKRGPDFKDKRKDRGKQHKDSLPQTGQGFDLSG